MKVIKYWAVKVMWLIFAIMPTAAFLDFVCGLSVNRDHGFMAMIGFMACQIFFAEIYARKYLYK